MQITIRRSWWMMLAIRSLIALAWLGVPIDAHEAIRRLVSKCIRWRVGDGRWRKATPSL